jgi:hypothetical protein
MDLDFYFLETGGKIILDEGAYEDAALATDMPRVIISYYPKMDY